MSIKYCINPACKYHNTAQDDQHNDGKCVACDNPLPLSVYSGNDASDGVFATKSCESCENGGKPCPVQADCNCGADIDHHWFHWKKKVNNDASDGITQTEKIGDTE